MDSKGINKEETKAGNKEIITNIFSHAMEINKNQKINE